MITIKVLDSAELIEEACALLYKTHIEQVQWDVAPDNPSQIRIENRNNRNLLIDRFTDNATWFGAFDDQKLIGCTRLCGVDENNLLEIEGYPNSSIVRPYLPKDKNFCVESTRTAVAKEYTGQGIVKLLLLAAFTYCEENHYSLAACVSNGYLKSLLKRIGYPLKMEHAFKYEPQDPLAVNFYFADYNKSEIKHMIRTLRGLNNNLSISSTKIFNALEIVAPILPTPVYWQDTNGIVLGLNEHCLKGMGATRDVIGKTPYEFYSKEIAEQILTHHAEVMRKGEILSQDERIEDITTGQVKYFRNIKAPLYDDEGKVIGIIGSAIEVTAEKEAEKLRIENQKHKSETERYRTITEQQEKFRLRSDRVAHDIRSPLASLIMLANYCTGLEEESRNILRTASNRLQDIANDLLRDYTPQQSHAHDFIQPTLVSTVLLEILSEKRSQYINSPIEFSHQFDFDSGFAFININRSDFGRSISNLINNAADAFEEKNDCQISVNIDSDEDSVIVRIEDNGRGMPPEVVKKLLNNVSITTGKEGGHGIGFPQIYDTLKNSNGKLDINSQLGHGTSISLTFPRIKAPEWIAESIKLNKNDIILIIDDDYSIHNAWDAKFKVIRKQAPDIQIWHFTSTKQANNFIDNLSEKAKLKVLLLVDYEFIKEETTGIEFIKDSGIKRSLVVTSYYGKDKTRNEAISIHTKILPKTLAPTILITFNESDTYIEQKNVDLVLVDDDKTFIHDFIELNGANKNIDRYYDPEEFLSKVAYYPKHTKIYIDNVFPNADMDGIDIAQNLHEQGYRNIFVITGKPYDRKVPSYVRLIAKEDIGIN